MRTIELSNHPSAVLRERRERLWKESQRRFEEQCERVRQANQQARQTFELKLAYHDARLERLRAELDAVGEGGGLRWWRRRRRTARLRKAERRTPRPAVPLAEPSPPPPLSNLPILTNEEAKLAAGIEGEERVANSLSEALGDEWTLLRGYCNRRGEIDQLLLGPAGLIAIEVKNRNATVSIKGDEWRFRRFDNYGNLVEEGPMTAGGGRSPSQQLREPAAELEEFLAKPERLRIIERLIVKDHEFHAKRSRARRRSSLQS